MGALLQLRVLLIHSYPGGRFLIHAASEDFLVIFNLMDLAKQSTTCMVPYSTILTPCGVMAHFTVKKGWNYSVQYCVRFGTCKLIFVILLYQWWRNLVYYLKLLMERCARGRPPAANRTFLLAISLLSLLAYL